jgi:hypothetical protein
VVAAVVVLTAAVAIDNTAWPISAFWADVGLQYLALYGVVFGLSLLLQLPRQIVHRIT